MHHNLAHEVAALRHLSAADLRRKFIELFREPTRSSNRIWLVKRIAWRLQALAEGDLSERARQRAIELARDTDLRLSAPRALGSEAAPGQPESAAPARQLTDNRLPRPGTVITRRYKGQMLQVRILASGFAFAGHVYPSLSAVAKAITGSHCNGFLFFRLGKEGGQP
jgi:Protein of unknown function (DUF2924)